MLGDSPNFRMTFKTEWKKLSKVMFRHESSQELIMFGESPLSSAGAQNRKKKELVAVGTGQALVRRTERRRKNPPITRLLEGRTDTASLYAIFLGIVRSLLTFVDDCTNGQRKEEEEGGRRRRAFFR